MRIFQILLVYSSGDGVGNVVSSIKRILDDNKIENYVYARFINDIDEDNTIKRIYELKSLSFGEDDIVMYHFSIGADINNEVLELNVKKVLIYHNVTLPDYFRYWHTGSYVGCIRGKKEAKDTANLYNKAIVLSKYSKDELVSFGWDADRIEIIPAISLSQFIYDPKREIIERFSNDDYVNFLFTGRMAPNKKIEDIILIYNYYKQNVNNKCRLFLVGSLSYKKYVAALKEYINENNIKDIHFTDKVSGEELEAYFRVSHLYICLSEHEGFCIPLLEAMKRNVPVVAYSSTAIPDTLSYAGILLENKEPQYVCNEIQNVLENDQYRMGILSKQKQRVDEFTIENYKDAVINCLEEINRDNNIYVKVKNTILNTDAIEESEIIALPRDEKYVVYGLGTAGKSIVDTAILHNDINLIAICDNGYDKTDYKNIRVLQHDECVNKYRECIFVVSVQDSFLDIIGRLLKDGVAFEKIYFYSYASKCLKGKNIKY